MNRPAAAPSYAADYAKYLEIMDELQHSLMHPNRRATLETCAEALTVVLNMTTPSDHR